MNIAYGVLRQRQYLQLLIGLLCRHPLHKFQPFILHALETGLYQLFFLDRVPESAAVNETVNALKAARIPVRLHGLVNGILRESIRKKPSLPTPGKDLNGNTCANHPTWLTERWQRHFGEEEMARICACNNREALLVLQGEYRKDLSGTIQQSAHPAGHRQQKRLFRPGGHCPARLSGWNPPSSRIR